MTSSDQKNSKSSTLTKGIYFGLQIWGLLIFAFIILGYPINLSIGFGFVGGIAGTIVVGWWISPEPSKMTAAESQANYDRSKLSRARSRMRPEGLRLTSVIKKRQNRRSGQEGLGLFGRRSKDR